MKWLNSIFLTVFFGFILMVACCSVALHYRLESLVVLYNIGLLVGTGAGIYGMAVITCLVLGRSRKPNDEFGRELQDDILFLGAAVITYGFYMGIYSYRGFIINHYSVAISTVICLCWLLFLYLKIEKEGKSQEFSKVE